MSHATNNGRFPSFFSFEAYNVLFNGTSPRDAVLSLMTRDKKDEIV